MNPIRYLLSETVATFECRWPAEEASQRLQQVLKPVKRTMFFARPRARSFVGRVSEHAVTLGVAHPGTYGLPFPVFRGSFEHSSGSTVLVGSFGPHPFAKLVVIAMGIFTGVAAVSVFAGLIVHRTTVVAGSEALAVIGALILGLAALVQFAAVGAEGDIEQISQAIRQRLCYGA